METISQGNIICQKLNSILEYLHDNDDFDSAGLNEIDKAHINSLIFSIRLHLHVYDD